MFRNQLEKRYLLQRSRFTWSPFSSVVVSSNNRKQGELVSEALGTIYLLHGGEFLRLGNFVEKEQIEDPEWWTKNLNERGYFFGVFGALKTLFPLKNLSYIAVVENPREMLLRRYLELQGNGILAHTCSFVDFLSQDDGLRWAQNYLGNVVECLSRKDVWITRVEDLAEDVEKVLHDIVLFMTGHEAPIIQKAVRKHICPPSTCQKFFGKCSDVSKGANLLSEDSQNIIWKQLEELSAKLGYYKEEIVNFTFSAHSTLARQS